MFSNPYEYESTATSGGPQASNEVHDTPKLHAYLAYEPRLPPDQGAWLVEQPMQNYEEISIDYGGARDALNVRFFPVARVPTGNTTLPDLPGSPCPLSAVEDNEEINSAFFCMSSLDAMCMEFRSTAPFCVKVYVDGYNVVTGKKFTDTVDGRIQDYIVVSGGDNVCRLDGIFFDGKQPRQFVAPQMFYDIRIQVIPPKWELPEQIKVNYIEKDLDLTKRRTIDLAQNGITGKSTWEELQARVAEKFKKSEKGLYIALRNEPPPWEDSYMKIHKLWTLQESYFRPDVELYIAYINLGKTCMGPEAEVPERRHLVTATLPESGSFLSCP